MARDMNIIGFSGNLARDPELKQTATAAVCRLRVASSARRRDPRTGEWRDKTNYIDVDVWGGQADACGSYLAKGSRVLVQGRLDYVEWTDANGADGGRKRSALKVIADHVAFETSAPAATSVYGRPPQQADPGAADGTPGVPAATGTASELDLPY